MRYLPNSSDERRQMLETCGVESLEDLFASLPPEVRLKKPLALGPGKSEYEILDYFRARGAENADGYASFLGAGVYRHYRPVLVDAVVSRGEFLTSYTPYQAEISQGILTSIFEFQTMICQLTGMEVANASVYCGSTAVPEAAMMAARITGRSRVLAARTVHPEYREVLSTCVKNQGMPVDEVGLRSRLRKARSGGSGSKLDERRRGGDRPIAEFLRHRGGRERGRRAGAQPGRTAGARFHGSRFAGDAGAGQRRRHRGRRVAVVRHAAELSAVRIAGVIATREKYVRQMPGRLVGQTTDTRGNRAFCLTLTTREQHIRREKATSNICTNQALIALMATVFMTVYGKQGLRELAKQNLAKAHYLASLVKPRFSGPFFNEFVAAPAGRPPEDVNARLLDEEDHRRTAARAGSIRSWRTRCCCARRK